MNVLGLMQLCNTMQPFYSHSLGIDERLARRQIVSAETLETFVRDVLHAAIGPADGVASGIAFLAARGGAVEDIPPVCAMLSSNRLPAEMRLASVQMGRRLWDVSRRWSWTECVHAQPDELAQKNDLHHAVAFGVLVSEATSNQVRAIAAYLLNVARSLVQAAVRAIPLDESAGQRVISAVQPSIVQLATACADKRPSDIGPIQIPPTNAATRE